MFESLASSLWKGWPQLPSWPYLDQLHALPSWASWRVPSPHHSGPSWTWLLHPGQRHPSGSGSSEKKKLLFRNWFHIIKDDWNLNIKIILNIVRSNRKVEPCLPSPLKRGQIVFLVPKDAPNILKFMQKQFFNFFIQQNCNSEIFANLIQKC